MPQQYRINPDVFTVTDLKIFDNVDFDQYLKIPGLSFSAIKGYEGDPNLGMQLGTRVHHYLNEPAMYDWQQSEVVVPIAKEIKKVVGEAIKFLKYERCFTCKFHYKNMVLDYRGRIDADHIPAILLDWKVIDGTLENAIRYFRYDRQMSGYLLATHTKLAMIVAWNKKKKRIEKQTIYPDARWWADIVLSHGVPFKK